MKKNKKSGYALLFTMIIISIMMTFALGASNSALKQMVLSSTATDSQIAFYQADTAGECALYIMTHLNFVNNLTIPINCGTKYNNGEQTQVQLIIKPNGTNKHLLKSDSDSNDPCFTIEIDNNYNSTTGANTTISARGYNVCDSNNPKQVERGIEITY